MEEWIEDASTTDEWSSMGYVGDNIAYLMTDAAFAALMVAKDTTDYLQDSGSIDI